MAYVEVAGKHSRVVVIVVFDGVTLLDVAGAGEVFVEANRFGADYRLKIASVDGGDVTSSIGTRLGVTDRISAIDSADTVLVAGSDNLPGRALDPGSEALMAWTRTGDAHEADSLSCRRTSPTVSAAIGVDP